LTGSLGYFEAFARSRPHPLFRAALFYIKNALFSNACLYILPIFKFFQMTLDLYVTSWFMLLSWFPVVRESFVKVKAQSGKG